MNVGAMVWPRLPAVKVEELHYGKLVAATGGPVPIGEGYDTTYRTRGLLHPGHMLPAKLLDGANLSPDHIEERYRRDGALLFRCVGETLVAMRARYRSEIGEGRSGRAYLQASIVQIAALGGFQGAPPSALSWVAREVSAEPDLITVPIANRLGVEPREIDIPTPPPLALASFDEIGPTRQIRLRAIVEAMITAAPCVIGTGAFDEPADEHLEMFLEDVELSMRILGQHGQTTGPSLVIACGLSEGLCRRSLLLSSLPQPDLHPSWSWQDIRRMVNPRDGRQRVLSQPASRASEATGVQTRAPDLPSGFSSRVQGRRSTSRLRGSDKLWDTVTRSHASVLREVDLVGSGQAGPLTPPAPDPRFDHLDERWRASGSRAGQGGELIGQELDLGKGDSFRYVSDSTISYRAPPAQNEELLLAKFHRCVSDVEKAHYIPSNVAALFGFIENIARREKLASWALFKAAEAQSPTNLLFALLLGLYERDDLIDNFTLTELHFAWPYFEMAEHHAQNQYRHWCERFFYLLDKRLVAVRALTLAEIRLYKQYSQHWQPYGEFSNDARQIIDQSLRYSLLVDNLENGGRPERSKDEKVRMCKFLAELNDRLFRSRQSGASAILCGTIDVMPNWRSLLTLEPRDNVIRKSRSLLLTELQASYEFIARLG